MGAAFPVRRAATPLRLTATPHHMRLNHTKTLPFRDATLPNTTITRHDALTAITRPLDRRRQPREGSEIARLRAANCECADLEAVLRDYHDPNSVEAR